MRKRPHDQKAKPTLEERDQEYLERRDRVLEREKTTKQWTAQEVRNLSEEERSRISPIARLVNLGCTAITYQGKQGASGEGRTTMAIIELNQPEITAIDLDAFVLRNREVDGKSYQEVFLNTRGTSEMDSVSSEAISDETWEALREVTAKSDELA